MQRTKLFFFFLGLVLVVVVGSNVFVQLGYRTQLYIWEFPIDIKSALLAILCYFFIRKFNEGFVFADIGMRRWDWLANLIAFFSPLVLLALIVVLGYLFRATGYEGVENSTTFLLATLFDVPAIYFFSFTTILLEEVIFRGFIFSTISKETNIILSSLLTSGLWAV